MNFYFFYLSTLHLKFTMLSKYFRYALSLSAAALKNHIDLDKKNSMADYNAQNHNGSVWDFNWDKRSRGKEMDANLKKVNSKIVRHIIMIRHGQYYQRREDSSERILTELGRKQAEVCGDRIRKLIKYFEPIPLTTLFASTMIRADQTARIICERIGLPVEKISYDPLLEEGAPVEPEPPKYNWYPEEKKFYEDGARIEAAFRKYFHRPEPSQKEPTLEVIVCHANVIRFFVMRALQLPINAWARMNLAHCSLTYVRILENGEVNLVYLGDTGYMPIDMVSYR
ncbi:Serine/threonine-protein phosphatase PGAM5, mitochondrial [Trichinella britovi]|uniref:Serine/threonine-protein phosphatase PGAM5, mitochondrial n=2 Tax=Trichinella TaxID=6333 RepID=A0A0V1DFM9_TRIBR|nr:Serine/threonine-protein phosphatase PGAM5, mitochondrial [Trichinella sp. T9]KRY60412.1 Serine/threonine-protein phosphatase PGAM5, mitochondrial [Trichinella britovi]